MKVRAGDTEVEVGKVINVSIVLGNGVIDVGIHTYRCGHTYMYMWIYIDVDIHTCCEIHKPEAII